MRAHGACARAGGCARRARGEERARGEADPERDRDRRKYPKTAPRVARSAAEKGHGVARTLRVHYKPLIVTISELLTCRV